MKRSVTPMLAALVALAIGTTPGQAQTPAPTPPLDPIGTFEFSTTVQGQNVSGSMIVEKKEDGTLGGRILTDAMPEIMIKSVAVDGRKLTITADLPDGALTIVCEFEDNNNVFKGNWALGGEGGAISGKRKTS